MPPLLAVAFFLINIFLIPGVFALTMFLLLLVILLALRLRPEFVAMWVLVYAAAIFGISFLPMGHNNEAALRPFVRTAVFLIGGTSAILLAVNRHRLEASHETLFRIISGLPLPVIVSDVSGSILLLSKQAQLMFRHDGNQMAGLSFFSTFIHPAEQGRAIATYVGYFDSPESTTFETVLRTRSTPELSLSARINIVTIGKHRFAITVMEEIKPDEIIDPGK